MLSSDLFMSACVCVCMRLFKVHAGLCESMCCCYCLMCVCCACALLCDGGWSVLFVCFGCFVCVHILRCEYAVFVLV